MCLSLIIALLWLGVFQIGWLVEFTHHASVWFPAAGLTYAALIVAGSRAIPAVLTSALIVTMWTAEHYGITLPTSELLIAGIAFAVAHILPYWAGAWLVNRLAINVWRSLPQLIVTFIVSAAVFSFIATWCVLFALVTTNMMPASDVSATWLAFWIGDLAGVVVMAPLFIALLHTLTNRPNLSMESFSSGVQAGPSSGYVYKVLLNVVMIAGTMLLAHFSKAPESAFAIFFLAITHMWIACTESPLFNVISLAISSFLIALLVHALNLMDHVMVYQFAINVVAANALFGIAVPRLAADNQKLRNMVFTDSLTKAASRDHLTQRAELEIMQSLNEGKQLSLIVFDLDHFKQVNDRFGHQAGDQVLVQACLAIRRILRPSDLLARFGGDEFVILLPDTDVKAAEAIAKRVLQCISQVRIEELAMSSSIGVSSLYAADTFCSLFERADCALYKAKQEGRNKVCCHTPPIEANIKVAG